MDNINTVLINDLSSQPYNPNVAYSHSWIGVAGANYPLFAQASYITNFDDLSISLSAEHVSLGDFNIADPITKLNANVVQVGVNAAALRVLTQDLDSVHDSFTIGDRSGNYTILTNSALNVFNTNPISSILISNPVTAVSVLNPVTAVQVLNSSIEISNDVGNPVPVTGIVQISSVNISDANWLFQVSRGKVAGATLKSFTGYSSAIDGAFQPVWELGTYTFLTSAQQLRLWSTSDSDTNVSVYIDGLDTNYNPVNETLVLTNGTVGVLTVNNYYRINSINLTRTPMAIGQIDLGTSNKSNILANIMPDTDRSSMTVYSVPNGYTFYLERVNAYCNYTVNSLGNNAIPVNAYFRSYTINNGLATRILQSPFYTSYTSTRVSPRPYPQKTDCQWQCKADAGYSIAVGLQVEGILISNAAL